MTKAQRVRLRLEAALERARVRLARVEHKLHNLETHDRACLSRANTAWHEAREAVSSAEGALRTYNGEVPSHIDSL